MTRRSFIVCNRFAARDVDTFVARCESCINGTNVDGDARRAERLAGKSLIELSLPKEGVLVLGVQQHQGTNIGAPTANTEVSASDVLVLYGPIERLEELDQRRAGKRGEVAHEQAVTKHEDVLEEQQELLATDNEAD